METQAHVLILLLFVSSLVSTLALAPSPSGGGSPGSYVQIQDVKEPRVQEVAKFAVTEHNTQAKTNLKFERVISGEYQEVNGRNYRLVIAAKDGINYLAEVYDVLYKGSLKLVSFTPLVKAV